MQDNTQRFSVPVTGRLLGFVQVQVGDEVYALPVQAVHFEHDVAPGDGSRAGGFFAEDSGQLGILVDEDASAGDVQAQILRACAEAVRHLSKRILN